MRNLQKHCNVLLFALLYITTVSANDEITLYTPECDWKANYCLPIQNQTSEELEVLVDGIPYEGVYTGCNVEITRRGHKETTALAIQLEVGSYSICTIDKVKDDSITYTVNVICAQKDVICEQAEDLIAYKEDETIVLNIAKRNLWQYNFYLDGMEYDDDINYEGEKPCLYYDLYHLLGKTFRVNGWIVDGNHFYGSFSSLDFLLELLNEQSGANVWRLDKGHLLIGGQVGKKNEGMPIILKNRLNTELTIQPKVKTEAEQVRLNVPPTASQLQIENITSGCYENIPLNSNWAMKK